MELYVIRHGEVDLNLKHLINGVNDSSLNETGIKQARSKQDEVKKLNLDYIICSPLLRTRQTCDIINVNNVEVIYDNRLIERDSRSMQYTLDSNLDLDIWYDHTKEVIYKDTEGFGSVCKRVYGFLDEIKEKYPNSNILLVTHGDVCKAIYTYFNKDSWEYIKNNEQKNCEIVKLEMHTL